MILIMFLKKKEKKTFLSSIRGNFTELPQKQVKDEVLPFKKGIN